MATRFWTARALLLSMGWMPLPLFAQDEDYDPDAGREVEVLHRQHFTVSGVVRLNSGVPPPEPIAVELLCDARLINQGFTDRKGGFTISVGTEPDAALLDASTSSRAPVSTDVGAWLSESRPLGPCHLRILVSGYRPQALALDDSGAFGVVDMGTIVLERLDGVAGAAISVTSYEAPRAAQKLLASAVREARRPRPNVETALEKLQAAVTLFPRYAAAWDLLGDCHWAVGAEEEARKAYEAALAADRDYLPPYGPLIRLAVDERRWADVDRLASVRLGLAPGAEVAYLHALALLELGTIESAERALEQARTDAGGERMPQVALIQAEIHIARGRFRQAAEQFEWFLSAAPDSLARPEIEAKLAAWRQDGKLAED